MMVERMRCFSCIITYLLSDLLQSRSVLESSTGWPHHASLTGVSLGHPHSDTVYSGNGKFSFSTPASLADPKLRWDNVAGIMV